MFQTVAEAVVIQESVTAILMHFNGPFCTGKLPPNFGKILGNQLKNLAAQGKLVRVKASFKLGEELKKAPKKPAAKKPAAKKPGRSGWQCCL